MAESNIPRLGELRLNLLHLHKALLDFERHNYEQHHGKVSSSEFLQLLIANEDFAWLRFFSEMIVKIDEMLDSKEPVREEDSSGIVSNARKLLDPSAIGEVFAAKYQDALQRDAAIVIAHQAVRESLK